MPTDEIHDPGAHDPAPAPLPPDAGAHRAGDPVNSWATEHYGFEDEADDLPAPDAEGRPPVIHHRRGRRRKTLIAAGALSVLMVGGVGGAAIATDGGGDGPGGAVQFQLDDGPGDDGFSRGAGGGDRGGFR